MQAIMTAFCLSPVIPMLLNVSQRIKGEISHTDHILTTY